MDFINLNNYAADVIAQGKYAEGYHTLQRALKQFATSAVTETSGLGISSGDAESFRIEALLLSTSNIDRGLFKWPFTCTTTHPIASERLIDLGAIAMFNMGLACHHMAFENACPPRRRNMMLFRCEKFYIQSFGMAFHNKLLRIAILMNLMDIAFEQGDLPALYSWKEMFADEIKYISTALPELVSMHIHTACVHYMVELKAARAA